MSLFLILALLAGQPTPQALDAVPSPDLPSQRATVPLLPPSLEFWLESESARQAERPQPPSAVRPQAVRELGVRATGPGGDALIRAALTELYTRAAARPDVNPAARTVLQSYLADPTPQPSQQ